MSEDKDMSRRDFFRFSFGRSKETAKEAVKTVAKIKFPRTSIRPPGAMSEERFLVLCTRCGDCKTACPHDAIHMMDISGGIAANTPFIDPEHTACQFCEDMPCIKSCEPRALLENPKDVPYKIGVAELHAEHCLVAQGQYCDYCFKACPPGVNAIKEGDDRMPVIDQEACVGCGKCEYICVSQTAKAITIRPV
jgi:ferredoxin-type protein NapG